MSKENECKTFPRLILTFHFTQKISLINDSGLMTLDEAGGKIKRLCDIYIYNVG